MKDLKYFEKEAEKLINTGGIDYRLVSKGDLILNLMKKYRKDKSISFLEYKPIYDKWFNTYHA